MPKEKILLVDDNKGQRVTLESILNKSGFHVTAADCGTVALSLAQDSELAAALVDIKLPDITGIDVLKKLKADHPDLFVIMMTGYSDTDYAVSALNSGASAYLLKPTNIEQLKTLLKQAIERQRLMEENHAMAAALQEYNLRLEEMVRKRTDQLSEAYRVAIKFYGELKKNFDSTLEILSIAIDQRDHLTSSHSFRVTQYALEIGKVLGLPADELEKLRYSGLMHDLGKIVVKEEILTKEGSLTAEEYREIQTHARGTYLLLSRFRFRNNLEDVPFIASSHHERFDGQGYPKKLRGGDIPLMARILAVADVLDAITSKRHYRSAMSLTDALSLLKRESGGHFDPECVNALFKVQISEFLKIHMAEFLNKLKAQDLIELSPYTLDDMFKICISEEPTPAEMEALQLTYHYYQGPVPVKFEGKILPAPQFKDLDTSANC